MPGMEKDATQAGKKGELRRSICMWTPALVCLKEAYASLQATNSICNAFQNTVLDVMHVKTAHTSESNKTR
jgi:hypothetical protein